MNDVSPGAILSWNVGFGRKSAAAVSHVYGRLNRKERPIQLPLRGYRGADLVVVTPSFLHSSKSSRQGTPVHRANSPVNTTNVIDRFMKKGRQRLRRKGSQIRSGASQSS